MRKNHTELVFILDRSGSMDIIKKDAIGGFNSFVEQEKNVEGTASVTLVLFDDEYKVVYQEMELNEVAPLTGNTYVPRGLTALLDAIGRTINEVGTRLAAKKEKDRPEKVMIIILTDGAENASYKFNKGQIKEMITHQREKYNWEFAFLAANQDAFLEADNLGISKEYTANVQLDSAETTRAAYASANTFSKTYRGI